MKGSSSLAILLECVIEIHGFSSFVRLSGWTRKSVYQKGSFLASSRPLVCMKYTQGLATIYDYIMVRIVIFISPLNLSIKETLHELSWTLAAFWPKKRTHETATQRAAGSATISALNTGMKHGCLQPSSAAVHCAYISAIASSPLQQTSFH